MFLRFHPTSYLFINLQKRMTVSLCLILLDSPFKIEHRGISFFVGRVAMDSILSMASSILPILLDPQYILVQNFLPFSGIGVLVILLHLFFHQIASQSGLPLSRSLVDFVFCEFYRYGKSCKLYFKLSKSVSHCPLEPIHSDVWGPS